MSKKRFAPRYENTWEKLGSPPNYNIGFTSMSMSKGTENWTTLPGQVRKKLNWLIVKRVSKNPLYPKRYHVSNNHKGEVTFFYEEDAYNYVEERIINDEIEGKRKAIGELLV